MGPVAQRSVVSKVKIEPVSWVRVESVAGSLVSEGNRASCCEHRQLEKLRRESNRLLAKVEKAATRRSQWSRTPSKKKQQNAMIGIGQSRGVDPAIGSGTPTTSPTSTSVALQSSPQSQRARERADAALSLLGVSHQAVVD